MSYRLADKLKGVGSAESADTKHHLGLHYAGLALAAGASGGSTAGTDRAELLRRAEPLYLDSLRTSVAHYGQAHETSQLLAQSLAALRQTLVQATKVHPHPHQYPRQHLRQRPYCPTPPP